MDLAFQHELTLTKQFIDGILTLDPAEASLRVIGHKDTQNRCAVVSIQTLEVDMLVPPLNWTILTGSCPASVSTVPQVRTKPSAHILPVRSASPLVRKIPRKKWTLPFMHLQRSQGFHNKRIIIVLFRRFTFQEIFDLWNSNS